MKTEQSNTLQIVEEELATAKEIYESIQIKTVDDFATASDKTKEIKSIRKKIEEQKEKFTSPAKLIIAEARRIFDPAINWLENAERDLKAKATAFALEQEKKAQQQQEKIAKQVEAGKITTDKAIEKLENLPTTGKGIQTDSSSMQLRKRKVAVIKDPALIPDEYWVIDEVRVRKDALDREKHGLPQIPGMAIEEQASMASL